MRPSPHPATAAGRSRRGRRHRGAVARPGNARFADIADLKQDLLSNPPSAPICIVAREVLVDYLDPPQFSGLCRRLGGDRVDAVSTLAALGWDGTVGGMDRKVAAEERRAAAAQGRALRRYWHVS